MIASGDWEDEERARLRVLVKPIVDILESEMDTDGTDRHYAWGALAVIGAQHNTVQQLAKKTLDSTSDVDVRGALKVLAKGSISRDSAAKAIPLVSKVIRSNEERISALREIAGRYPDLFPPILQKALDSSDYEARREAVRTLSQKDYPVPDSFWDHVIDAYNDADVLMEGELFSALLKQPQHRLTNLVDPILRGFAGGSDDWFAASVAMPGDPRAMEYAKVRLVQDQKMDRNWEVAIFLARSLQKKPEITQTALKAWSPEERKTLLSYLASAISPDIRRSEEVSSALLSLKAFIEANP